MSYLAFLFILKLAAANPEKNKTCIDKGPEGFVYRESDNGISHYINEKRTLSLSVKCNSKVDIEKIKKSLVGKVSIKKLTDNVDYFELNSSQVITRTYLIKQKQNWLQFSFVTDAK